MSLALVLASGCTLPKIPATGYNDDILVFADDTTWSLLEPTVRFVFEDTIYTPVPESWFAVQRVAFSEWDANDTHKNRIIIGTLDGSGPVSTFIQQALDSTVQSLVGEGKEFYFARYDSKARGQILMFLVAPSHRDLDLQMRSSAPDLVYYFRNLWLKREMAELAADASYHKTEISNSLLRRNGWTLTIQHDYHVARDTSAGRFFWVRRATPEDLERWVFVTWWDASSPSSLDEQWIRSARDSVTRKWLRTLDDEAYVEIAPYNQEVETVNFADRFAYEVRGNWRFNDKSGGGPFVNYTFYDEATQRTYMLDGSIFAPRVEKKELIIQVEALLNTFRTLGDIPEADRVEILGTE
jgi:hypothetical protein